MVKYFVMCASVVELFTAYTCYSVYVYFVQFKDLWFFLKCIVFDYMLICNDEVGKV
jgi:hypothetical protein